MIDRKYMGIRARMRRRSDRRPNKPPKCGDLSKGRDRRHGKDGSEVVG
jgi:hypothetical protein